MVFLNVMIFVMQVTMPEQAEFFLLHYGSFNPVSWFSSICMHSSIGHLIGNIVGLVLFGVIIEGKVGWWRFALIYFAIGVPACALEQTIMLFFPGGASLGASGVVYGLIAMAMIWAPENKMSFSYLYVIFFRPVMGTFQVSFLALGFFAIGWQYIIAAFTMFQMSSAVLHLMGAIPGFAIAVMMIKLRQVDCDGYDMLSVWAGTRGQRTLTVAEEKRQNEEAEKRRLANKRIFEEGLVKVNQYIERGHHEMALKRFEMLQRKKNSLKMSEPQLVKIIKAFNGAPDMETKLKAIPVIKTYLEHYDTYRVSFSLMLARTHLIMESRPRKALRVVQTLDWNQLNPKQKQFTRKLIQLAKDEIKDGVLEVD